jgi:hypothetical protein
MCPKRWRDFRQRHIARGLSDCDSEVDGDFVADIAIATASPEAKIGQVLNQRIDSVRESFKGIARNLQACPAFVVDDQSPANMSLSVDPFFARARELSARPVLPLIACEIAR